MLEQLKALRKQLSSPLEMERLEKDILLAFLEPKQALEVPRSVLRSTDAALALAQIVAPAGQVFIQTVESGGWICSISTRSMIRSRQHQKLPMAIVGVLLELEIAVLEGARKASEMA